VLATSKKDFASGKDRRRKSGQLANRERGVRALERTLGRREEMVPMMSRLVVSGGRDPTVGICRVFSMAMAYGWQADSEGK